MNITLLDQVCCDHISYVYYTNDINLKFRQHKYKSEEFLRSTLGDLLVN